MSDYYGDIALGDTIDMKFTTRQISGAPSTLSGSPVISTYPGNSTTEFTTGITLTVDFDSRTGYNNIRVVATSGNTYATATNYDLAITTGTVNSVSVVGESVASFSIENRQSNVKFWNGTAVATPATAGIPEVNVKNINNVSASAVTTIKAVQGLAVDGVITTLTNLPAITANWLTAAGIAASALNGKGDWLLASSYTAPTNLTAAQIATGIFQDTTAGDFTVAASIGKSIMNGVALGTGLTINGYTGNTPQTGDSYARIGLAGVGLTNLGDTRIANLDAAVSTRMATFTVPANFASLGISAAGNVNSDVKKMNAATVNGTGTAGDLWRG